ncbi:MAG: nucleotidyl transferase AbiEii/AbiGii toxin family protein [Bacteroidia bacterium]|nr:nucleotidyl transferase AbiEii/AbiGii toxin family protein [Bacteroidia bacterium]
MIDWLKLTDDQRRTTLEQAGYNSGIPANALEKDWWVTLTLKALFSGAYKDFILFKGGTSLSKCWQLIERFSEDIDIALDPKAFGEEYKTDPTKNFVKQLKKKGCEFTSTHFKDDLEKQLNALGVPAGTIKVYAADVPPERPDTDPQTIFVEYATLFDHNPYLENKVKVEVSIRYLKEPSSNAEVQSLLNEYFPNEAYKEVAFTVTAIEAHRTFLEKTFLLHEEFLKPDVTKIRKDRMSRHLYDLEKIMDKAPGQKALQDAELYSAIIKHRENYFFLPWVNYESLKREHISFVLPDALKEAYDKDYQTMKEQMIYSDAIEFDVLLERINELLARYRGVKNEPKIIVDERDVLPYKFYRNDKIAKYETKKIDLGEEYKILRLKNIILNHMEIRSNLSLTILVESDTEEAKKYSFNLESDLYYNPIQKVFLHFIDGHNEFIDIPLPKGRNWVTVKVNLLSDIKEFEMTLGCTYL